MVILVDDEDDVEREQEQVPHETGSARRSNNTADALPWDGKPHRANSSSISTSSRSDTTEPKQSDETGMLKLRRPTFQQPSEMGDSAQHSIVVKPGPSIAGRAYPATPSGDRRVSVDQDSRSSIGGADSRPTSQGGTIFVPIQSTMQPKVKIAGRPSFDGDGARKAPINMPGRSIAEKETSTDGKPSARRTYKSLSPYGILFED